MARAARRRRRGRRVATLARNADGIREARREIAQDARNRQRVMPNSLRAAIMGQGRRSRRGFRRSWPRWGLTNSRRDCHLMCGGGLRFAVLLSRMRGGRDRQSGPLRCAVRRAWFQGGGVMNDAALMRHDAVDGGFWSA